MKQKTYVHILVVLWGLTIAALLGGCAAEESHGMAAGSDVNCRTDADCPADHMCRAGLCSVSEAASTNLNFRFIPPNSTDFLPQHIDEVDVRTGQQLDFGLERSITVNSGEAANNEDDPGQPGGIRYANSPLTGPSGTLVFRPARADDQLFSREARVDAGNFSARITPGRYSLTFIPEDRALLPKKTWPEEVFESNTYLRRTLRGSDDLIAVSGTLSRNVTLSEGATTAPEEVSGARVYATSTDGRHTSTMVTTDELGRFELKVEPNSGTYDLIVVPTESSPQVLSRTFDSAFEVTEDQCIPRSGRASDRCLLTVDLGAYPAEPVPVRMALDVSDEYADSAELAGVTVVVTGTVAAGTYTRRHQVDFSEQSGRWETELELFPVAWSSDEVPQYTIEIVPPARSPFARTALTLEGSLDLDALHVFEVEMKRRLQGRVVDTQHDGVSAAKLEFRVAPQDDEESHDDRAISATTEEDGSFEVWLEETDYDVMVVPPPNTGQPRLLTDVAADDIERGDQLHIELPKPAVFVGSVFGAASAEADAFDPISEVTVEAYKHVEGRTIVLGQARTDASGEFRMALSSEL